VEAAVALEDAALHQLAVVVGVGAAGRAAGDEEHLIGERHVAAVAGAAPAVRAGVRLLVAGRGAAELHADRRVVAAGRAVGELVAAALLREVLGLGDLAERQPVHGVAGLAGAGVAGEARRAGLPGAAGELDDRVAERALLLG